jgi:hypothetical protein
MDRVVEGASLPEVINNLSDSLFRQEIRNVSAN